MNRIQKIEEEIEQLEERIRQIDAETETIATDYLTLQKLYEEKEALQTKCDCLLEEWSNLQEDS